MCNKYLYRVLVFLSLCVLSTSANALDLNKLYELNPEYEAELVAKSKNVFFVGVWGYSLMTPEAPGVSYCWRDHGMVVEVPNTGDAVIDVKWQSEAEKFASIFNKTILKLRPELFNHECAHNN